MTASRVLYSPALAAADPAAVVQERTRPPRSLAEVPLRQDSGLACRASPWHTSAAQRAAHAAHPPLRAARRRCRSPSRQGAVSRPR
eukprot:scaffold1206_cov388-Prasinococcus_capsulatus_cf.AAC.40